MTATIQTYRNDLIRAAMASADPPWTNEMLAKEANLSETTVSSIRNGSTSIQYGSLAAVARTLGLEMQRLFEPKEEAA